MAKRTKRELPGNSMLDAMALLGWRESQADMNWDAFEPSGKQTQAMPPEQLLAKIQARREEPQQNPIQFPMSQEELIECAVDDFDDDMRMVARNGSNIPDHILQRMKRDRQVAIETKKNNHAGD